ncbi:MAG: hypothetical protein JWN31_492 [Frankiales bacterium]|nr:hypothetical protein [Frankiales bacterium]
MARWLIRLLMPVLAVLLAAVWVVVAVLSVFSRRQRALRVATMAVVYAFGETVAMLACIVLVRAGPRPHLWLLKLFLGTLLRLARPVFGFRLQLEERDDLPEGRPVIVLARHAGPGASFALVHLLMDRYGRHPKVVLKEQLRLDPAIDLLLSRIGCTWIPARSDGSAVLVEQAARDLADNQALVLFPEGADWTPLRHMAAVARLRRKGRWKEAREALRMPHVLPPRPAGTVAALEAAPTADVVVFTHCGHDELLDLSKAWQALPLREPLQMTWWRAADIPPGQEEQWLQETWRDIDAWVEARAS